MRIRGLISSAMLLVCAWVGGAAAAQERGGTQERMVSAHMGYAVGKSDVNLEFQGNGSAVELLDKVLSPEAVVSRIEVVSASSPDGPYALNKRLAAQRAASAVDFLKQRYALPDSLFVVSTVNEDWQGSARYLERSGKPWKEEALQIIHAAGKNRKALLQDLWVGEAWEDLKLNAFPQLRCTQIRVTLQTQEAEADANRILFRSGYRRADSADRALQSLRQKVQSGYRGPIVLTGYASPDGSASANEKLALSRAQSVRDYLVNELHYPAGQVEVRGGGVHWDGLAARAKDAYYGPDRSRVLEILDDATLTPAQKKHALLVLDGGRAWQALKRDVMPALCAVEIAYVTGAVPETEAVVPDTEVVVPDTEAETVVPVEEETEVVVPPLTEEIQEAEEAEDKIEADSPKVILEVEDKKTIPAQRVIFGAGSNVLSISHLA